MQCEEAELYLAQLAFGELDADSEIGLTLDSHMELCDGCREKLGDLRVTASLLMEAATAQEPLRLSPKRKAKVIKRLRGLDRASLPETGPYKFPWRPVGIAASIALMSAAGLGFLGAGRAFESVRNAASPTVATVRGGENYEAEEESWWWGNEKRSQAKSTPDISGGTRLSYKVVPDGQDAERVLESIAAAQTQRIDPNGRLNEKWSSESGNRTGTRFLNGNSESTGSGDLLSEDALALKSTRFPNVRHSLGTYAGALSSGGDIDESEIKPPGTKVDKHYKYSDDNFGDGDKLARGVPLDSTFGWRMKEADLDQGKRSKTSERAANDVHRVRQSKSVVDSDYRDKDGDGLSSDTGRGGVLGELRRNKDRLAANVPDFTDAPEFDLDSVITEDSAGESNGSPFDAGPPAKAKGEKPAARPEKESAQQAWEALRNRRGEGREKFGKSNELNEEKRETARKTALYSRLDALPEDQTASDPKKPSNGNSTLSLKDLPALGRIMKNPLAEAPDASKSLGVVGDDLKKQSPQSGFFSGKLTTSGKFKGGLQGQSEGQGQGKGEGKGEGKGPDNAKVPNPYLDSVTRYYKDLGGKSSDKKTVSEKPFLTRTLTRTPSKPNPVAKNPVPPRGPATVGPTLPKGTAPKTTPTAKPKPKSPPAPIITTKLRDQLGIDSNTTATFSVPGSSKGKQQSGSLTIEGFDSKLRLSVASERDVRYKQDAKPGGGGGGGLNKGDKEDGKVILSDAERMREQKKKLDPASLRWRHSRAFDEASLEVKDSRISGLVQPVDAWSTKHAAVDKPVRTQSESLEADAGLLTAYRNEALKRKSADQEAAEGENEVASIVKRFKGRSEKIEKAKFRVKVLRDERRTNEPVTIEELQKSLSYKNGKDLEEAGLEYRSRTKSGEGEEAAEEVELSKADEALADRNHALAEALRKKTAEADTLMTQLELNKERVIDLSRQTEEYEKSKGYQPTPDTVASIPNLPTKHPLQPIFGRITQVRKYNGFDYVQINIGSQDKVEVGQRFMIHTDNVYHGDVIITKVDGDAAAGRISIKRSKVVIRKGMEVRSGISNDAKAGSGDQPNPAAVVETYDVQELLLKFPVAERNQRLRQLVAQITSRGGVVQKLNETLIVHANASSHKAIANHLQAIRDRDQLNSNVPPAPEVEGPLPAASKFKQMPVNPYVMASQDRFSTFGIDTDTASYALTRRYVRAGYKPPAGAVRMEEFVNAFDYNYPSRGDRLFTTHAEAAVAPFGGGKVVLVKIGVKAKTIGRAARKSAHLVFCLDASGSMDRPDRLPLAKDALKLLVGQLDRTDRVTLIAYGTKTHLVLEATPATQAKRIIAAIDSIQPGRSTNMIDGLGAAYTKAREHFRVGQINRVILCSDGVANIGPTDATQILQAVAADRQQGITLTTVGFGLGDYDDTLMEQLANRGDGQYAYIDSMAEARRLFVDELGATLQTVAKDAKIQVEFNPTRVRRYRLIGYENRDIADKDFRNDKIDAGEVGSGQSATALYELELIGQPSADAQDDLGTVRVRYQDLETGRIVEIDQRLASNLVRKRTASSDPRFFLAASAAEFAEILRKSPHARKASLISVRRVMTDVVKALPLDERAAELLKVIRSAEGLPDAP
jgi:Ca-activated chloride channel family protein